MLLSVNSGMHGARPGKPRYDMITDTVDFFAKIGVDALDVSFCPCIYEGDIRETILDGDNWKEKLDLLVRRCREKGLQIAATHLPYRFNYLDPDEEGYAENYAVTVKALQASEYIGAPCAVVHLKEIEGSEVFFKKLIRDAGTKHTLLAIENNPRLSLESLMDVHDRLKAEGYPVGICFDIGHCNIQREYHYDVCEAIEMLGKRIKVLHLHDNRGDKDAHQAPYEGNIPWEKVMQTLKKIGFQGEFNYELINANFPEWLREDQARYYTKIARYLISVFENS